MKKEEFIKNYFTAYQDYFWSWDIDYSFAGNVIAQPTDYKGGYNAIILNESGITIAYKEQIKEVLTRLSDRHFPPFGALLLAFAASNSYAEDITSPIVEAQKNKFKRISNIKFDQIKQFLRNINALPEELRTGKNKTYLLYILFENASFSLGKNHSDEIFQLLKLQENTNKGIDYPRELALRDFYTLHILAKKFPTTKAILNALKNIPKVEEEILIEDDEESQDFIQQLRDEPKTFFLGSLLHRLQAGIKLPMVYNQPGEQTLGGISDITNKGDFDRMLLSEFANDDEVFLHRIANNEALYIRRENPPIEDQRVRYLLIDNTIKNWGIPKILSFAVSFAIKHHPKTDIPCRIFLIENTYEEAQVDTLIEVIDATQKVSAELDATQGLEVFFDELNEEDAEVIFLTSEKTLAHDSVQNVLNKNIENLDYLVSSNTQGELNFFKYQNRSKKHIQKIQLDLHNLWKHVPKRKLKRAKVPHDIPKKHDYPLLYGRTAKMVGEFYHDEVFYFMTKKGGLYYLPAIKNENQSYRVKGLKYFGHYPWIQHLLNAKFTFYKDELIAISIDKINKSVTVHSKSFSYDLNSDDFEFHHHYQLVNDSGELYITTFRREYFNYRIDFETNTLIKVHDNNSSYYSNCGYFVLNLLCYFKEINIVDENTIIFHGKKSKFRLNIQDVISYKILRKDKNEIEESYGKKDKFSFKDGSQIIVNKLGILEFHSANNKIPTFYLSSFVDYNLAFASDVHFAGNEYFLPFDSELEIISPQLFHELYLKKFLQNIIDYATQT